MDSIPRLETRRLKLRAIFPSDAQAIFDIFSDPKVTLFYEFETYDNLHQIHGLISKFIGWFQDGQAVRWAMIRKDNGELIGTCCFDTFNPRFQSVNLGYNVRSDHWGKGVATEGVQAIIDYAFEHGIEGRINRIQAITVPDNLGSERVLKKLGFEKEGLMRQYGYWKGQYHDMNLFSLISNRNPAGK